MSSHSPENTDGTSTTQAGARSTSSPALNQARTSKTQAPNEDARPTFGNDAIVEDRDNGYEVYIESCVNYIAPMG